MDTLPLIFGFVFFVVVGWYFRVALVFFFPILFILLFVLISIVFHVAYVLWPDGIYKNQPILSIFSVILLAYMTCIGYIAWTHWSGPTPDVRAYFHGYTYSAEAAPSAALTRALALPANRPLRRISKISVDRLYLRIWLHNGREATFARQAAHHPDGWCCTSGHWYAPPAGQYKTPLQFLARCTRAAICSVHVAPRALRQPFTAADVSAMVSAMRTGLAWMQKSPASKARHKRQQLARAQQRRDALATWNRAFVNRDKPVHQP